MSHSTLRLFDSNRSQIFVAGRMGFIKRQPNPYKLNSNEAAIWDAGYLRQKSVDNSRGIVNVINNTMGVKSEKCK